jgi:hypothetical protein
MRDSRARELIGTLSLDQRANQQAVFRANQLLQSYRRRERVADPAG